MGVTFGARLLRLAMSAAAGLGLVSSMTIGFPASASAASSSFTSIFSPLTAANDYITDVPSCGVGPVGLLDDGQSFFVTDYCNSTTYKYDITSGAPKLTLSLQNGFTHGLALLHGVYYGIASNEQSIVPQGVYSFSPTTLKVTSQVVGNPCGDLRGLAADPATGDLIMSGDCGLFRVKNPASAVPSFQQLAAGNLDGITVDPVTNTVWAADNGNDAVIQYYSTDGSEITSIPMQGGPDGLAIASPDAPGGIGGNLFVNRNDGIITMIDRHNANATSVVASGGSRGDFVSVGPDGFLYATQSDRVEQIQPAIFSPTNPSPPPSTVKSTSPDYNRVRHISAFDPKVHPECNSCRCARWRERMYAHRPNAQPGAKCQRGRNGRQLGQISKRPGIWEHRSSSSLRNYL